MNLRAYLYFKTSLISRNPRQTMHSHHAKKYGNFQNLEEIIAIHFFNYFLLF